MRIPRRLAVAVTTGAVATLALAAPALGTESAAISAYSVAAPTSVARSGLVARAVVPAGSTCPDLVADGRRYRTRARLPAASTSPAFAPILVCSRNVPAGATSASIGGLVIPAAMPKSVERITMFGDTGCRIWPLPFPTQNCASPTAWPLAALSRRVALERPDVVVFTGDFFYRETACSDEYQAFCGNSPPPPPLTSGETDSAYGWMADTLVPMAPMLRTAPIVMVRGNHEACGRAGVGFFLLMDPRPNTAQWCNDLNAPPTNAYAVDLPLAGSARRTLRLVVADSADGSDTKVSSAEPSLRTMYTGAQALAAPAAGRQSWLLTHRPIFALVSESLAGTGSQWSSEDQTAASAGLISRYGMILSSHIHLAQSVQIPGQPGQLVLGNGGTMLDESPTAIPSYGPLQTPQGVPLSPDVAPFPTATAMWSSSTFGYATAVPTARGGAWTIVNRDTAGRVFARCNVANQTIACQEATR